MLFIELYEANWAAKTSRNRRDEDGSAGKLFHPDEDQICVSDFWEASFKTLNTLNVWCVVVSSYDTLCQSLKPLMRYIILNKGGGA